MLKYYSYLGLILLVFSHCQNKNDQQGVSITTPSEEVVDTRLKNGDIIFQTSMSRQSQAIQLATKSPYSHMGIIYETKGDYWVYEAVGPVKLTPLKQWIQRGKDEHYVVKRLKNAKKTLTPTVLKKMKTVGEQFQGKPYDLYFEWSDDKIYCSELVWKIYKAAAGIELSPLSQLKDFDLSHPVVQQKIQERYRGAIPEEEWVISPAAIYESQELIQIPQD